ncbi:hypothetical protein [uncultured Bacteroides sp.]|uniref:hypothetical protein n=1 Tax=uncultured Bacteroides sp. TaxID=162156 RepID=UPI0025DA774B|nr:hypothetical protein [uncultured Bacteroides sp.]
MNSYQLISKLRKVRADTYLAAIDQALFHELVAVCNEKGWKDVFEVRSSTLCASLNIWDKTLRKSRNALADAGLISFESSKDKRVGCFYSFSLKLSNDMKTSVISSVNGTDENTEENTDDAIAEKTQSSVNNTVISSVLRTDENTDDKSATPVISSVNGTDETQIPPIIDIKTINKESLAHTHESPPPPKPKRSKKVEGDVKPLVYPFTSIAFMSTWETLRQTPKWKKKLNYALQLSLDKLGQFEEEFAIQQMARAIESGWTGVVFTGTERDYQEWLNIKYGKTGTQGPNNRHADKAAKAKMLLDEYAAIEQGSSAIDHQAEIPDL